MSMSLAISYIKIYKMINRIMINRMPTLSNLTYCILPKDYFKRFLK